MFALVLSILPFVPLVFHDVYTKSITLLIPRLPLIPPRSHAPKGPAEVYISPGMLSDLDRTTRGAASNAATIPNPRIVDPFAFVGLTP
jgi:hypothetical protein